MAHGVNIYTTNWHWTGTNVPTPQAEVDITIQWKDDADADHEWSGILTFPNDLQDVPIAWLKDELVDLLYRAARKKLGIDPGEV